MSFVIVALFILLAQLSGEPLRLRIVSHPDAPAVLVGKPCEIPVEVRAVATANSSVELFGRIKSDVFACPFDCRLGIKSAGNKQLTNVRISRLHLERGGTFAGFESPSLPVTAAESCNGMRLVRDPYPPSAGGDDDGFLVYLSEATFADGSVWRISDSKGFRRELTETWRKQLRK